MTRDERIKKLANAIKLYRGIYNPTNGKWIRPPQPAKRADVVKWLESLRKFQHYPAEPEVIIADMTKIDGFKTRPEYDAWIKTF